MTTKTAIADLSKTSKVDFSNVRAAWSAYLATPACSRERDAAWSAYLGVFAAYRASWKR